MPSSACLAPPSSPLFPYPTLFRSLRREAVLVPEPLVPVDEVVAALAGPGGRVDALVGVEEAGAGVAVVAAVGPGDLADPPGLDRGVDRKSTRLNSSHLGISYAVFCLLGSSVLSTLSLPDALPISSARGRACARATGPSR